MSQPGFAAIIPVGPKAIDLARGLALIESLVAWQPDIAWCVIVEDAPQARGLAELPLFPATCRASSLISPRKGRGHFWSGGVGSGMFASLSWVQANTNADFALIIETDALVIGPFATSVRGFLQRAPDAAMIGTIGQSCNESFLPNFERESSLLTAYRLLPPATSERFRHVSEPLLLDGVGPFSPEQRQIFDTVRPHIEAAIRNGYSSNEFCQGGAQIVSRAMIDRMAAAGYFEHPEVWMYLPFPGDQILPMYAWAVGLRMYACTAPGEPFAVQGSGLPYSLEETVARGHSLVHSVKNDSRYTETEIRAFFRARRREIAEQVPCSHGQDRAVSNFGDGDALIADSA